MRLNLEGDERIAMGMETEQEFLAGMKLFNNDHFPDGWPAVRMRDINRLLEIIAERDKSLSEQAKDYAARHVGFAKELDRLCEVNEELSKALELACEHVLPASVKLVDDTFSIEEINNNVPLQQN